MTTLDDVILGLECCYESEKIGQEKCEACPYQPVGKRNECYVVVCRDALTMLRAAKMLLGGLEDQDEVPCV